MIVADTSKLPNPKPPAPLSPLVEAMIRKPFTEFSDFIDANSQMALAPGLDPVLREFYEKYVGISVDDSVDTFWETIPQYKSGRWHTVRVSRIPSTKGYAVSRAKKPHTRFNAWKHSPRDCHNLREGRKNEPFGLQKYKTLHPRETIFPAGNYVLNCNLFKESRAQCVKDLLHKASDL